MPKMTSVELKDEPETRTVGSAEGITTPESESEKAQELIFPEGGARAWAVALGCAGILFCTFGYINAFG